MKNLLLRGNSDMSWSRNSGPACHLCNNPYNSDLTYIRCETCENWYHAEAVELEESKIGELVGFKCCRCRRIRTPVCPYLGPEAKKKLEAKRPRTRAPKAGNSGLNPDHGTISEQPKKLASTAMLPKTGEVMCVNEEDPLLYPLPMVEQFTERNSEMDLEWNAAGTGPQKLRVRRHTKNEKNVEVTTANDFSRVKLSKPIEPNNLMNPLEKSLSPCVERDVSKNGFEHGIVFDYEDLNDEDKKFEPQTYFSFTELLTSDNGDEVDASGYMMGDWENLCAVSRDRSPEFYGESTKNQQEPTIAVKSVGPLVPCRRCSLKEPCPDLCCEICGLWIHRDCSPWDEQPLLMGNWRCGNCREWQ